MIINQILRLKQNSVLCSIEELSGKPLENKQLNMKTGGQWQRFLSFL